VTAFGARHLAAAGGQASFEVGRPVTIAGRALSCLALIACGVGALGATDADLARARALSSEGAVVFEKDCAGCHGRRGEGMADAPPILGPGALPEYQRDRPATGVSGVEDPQQMQIELLTRRTGSGMRGPFRNELDVYTFVSAHVPKSRKGLPTEEDEWAVLTFLMAAQGVTPPSQGVTADDAMSLAVPRR